MSSRTVNLLQDKDPVYTARPYRDYRLQYNDEIYCTILTKDTEFSKEFNGIITTLNSQGGGVNYGNQRPYTIYEDGNISIPYFGEINIVGRTIPEAEDIIQNRMRQAYPDAQVNVILSNNSYYVVSDEKTGRFELYKDNTTIYQALAMSGRPSNRIDLSKVKIVRTNEQGKSFVKVFDLRAESVVESEFYYVKPNDVIYYSTRGASFFQINSFTSIWAVISAPIGVITTILAFTVAKN
jgi:polysaccharide export outer membrane protein